MTRETPLQDTFENLASEVPELVLRNLIEEKLVKLDLKLSKKSVRRIAKEILDADLNAISVNLGDEISLEEEQKEILLTFTEDEQKAAKAKLEKLLGEIPDIVERTSTRTAKKMVRVMQKQWHQERGLRRAEFDMFSERLVHRWRKGLTPLQLMLEISLEYADARLDELRNTENSDIGPRTDVLFALHIRACQVTAEILTLLKAGYADGAMARWRTLYELSVIMMLIADNRDELAQRYIDHNHVDVKKAANKHMENIEHSGYDAIPETQLEVIDKNYQEVLAKYGKQFRNEYGWAATAVGNDNPNFTHLMNAVQGQSVHPYYKMASFNVHAGARALFFRHTDMLSRSGVLAGASNAGLESPGTQTAFALFEITCHLVPDDEITIDDAVFLETLVLLRDKAEKGFRKANKKLNMEDADLLSILEEADTDLEP